MDMEPYLYIIAVLGGLAAGFINTLAGNGSVITLTILTELIGLPGNLANGTNRVGVMANSVMASWVFHKNGKLKLDRGLPYIVPTVLGAVVGVIVAVMVSNEQFKIVFRFLMVVMLLVILIKPKRWLRETDTTIKPNLFITIPLFLALGFYGGFIQMGMGIFFLAAMVIGAKFNIIEANGIKVFVVMLYTIVVLAIFQWKGLIDWKFGLILAVGQVIGGWLAATFASRYPKADFYAYVLVVVVVILALVKMFGLHEWLF
ncbi:MAG: putative membrane protein YfcA [Saprospiraceae bacterium]|jgi:uncharacterized membrane protein YfcA